MRKNLSFLFSNRSLLCLALFCLIIYIFRNVWLISRESLYDSRASVHETQPYVELIRNGDYPIVIELNNAQKLKNVFPSNIQIEVRNGDRIILNDNGTFTLSRMYGRKCLALGIPIGINSANPDDLVMLPGIGNTLAHRIVEYRSLNNGYKSIDELIKVKGIGERKLEAIKVFVSLD